MVVILSAGLVVFVVKSSTRREQEYLRIITTVLPTLQGIATGMVNINLRLESIEDNQMREWDHQAPNKLPRKKTGHTKPMKVADVEKAVEAKLDEIKEEAKVVSEVPDVEVGK